MKRAPPPWIFALLAAGFAVGAVYHLAALADPALDPSSPPWRHGLFVAINLLCMAGMLRRPRGFALLFALLTAQQVFSHGARAWAMWRDARRVDQASLVVLLAMPAILALLLRDGRPDAPGERR